MPEPDTSPEFRGFWDAELALWAAGGPAFRAEGGPGPGDDDDDDEDDGKGGGTGGNIDPDDDEWFEDDEDDDDDDEEPLQVSGPSRLNAGLRFFGWSLAAQQQSVLSY